MQKTYICIYSICLKQKCSEQMLKFFKQNIQ